AERMAHFMNNHRQQVGTHEQAAAAATRTAQPLAAGCCRASSARRSELRNYLRNSWTNGQRRLDSRRRPGSNCRRCARSLRDSFSCRKHLPLAARLLSKKRQTKSPASVRRHIRKANSLIWQIFLAAFYGRRDTSL